MYRISSSGVTSSYVNFLFFFCDKKAIKKCLSYQIHLVICKWIWLREQDMKWHECFNILNYNRWNVKVSYQLTITIVACVECTVLSRGVWRWEMKCLKMIISATTSSPTQGRMHYSIFHKSKITCIFTYELKMKKKIMMIQCVIWILFYTIEVWGGGEVIKS